MKLFVDDLRIPPDGWSLARTNDAAIRALHTWHVDEISIEHDISQSKRGYELETFMPVVYYLALMPETTRPKIIRIHTANPAGAIRMRGVLADAGIGCDIKESDQPFPK